MRFTPAAVLVVAFAGVPTGLRATSPAVTSVARHVLPFIEDDYSRALAEAKARKIPIFVECWAPW